MKHNEVYGLQSDGKIEMKRNEVYGVTISNQAEEKIEMKMNFVYGMINEEDYENPL